jgi:GNAT superfamily N-acetyltransferase
MPPRSPTATLPARTVRLRDGRDYRLRPLGPEDADAIVAFFRGLSTDTIRARYGYLIHDMTPERAHRLVARDPAAELPLGIFGPCPEAAGRLCALGRLVHAPDGTSAECAFLVHDGLRRLGLASRLLFYLRLAGRRRGLRRLFAQVRRENRPMLELFRHQGAQLHFVPDADYVEIDIPIRRNKFLFDKPRAAPSFSGMVQPAKKSFSPVVFFLDLVATAIAFVIFYRVVHSHVPSDDPAMIKLWGGLAAGCMTGIFWLALQMVKVVFRFQRDSRR